MGSSAEKTKQQRRINKTCSTFSKKTMRSVFQSSSWVCILGLMWVTVSPKVALAQQAGVLSGVVSEGLTKDPLIGATVRLQNTSYGAVTDLRGRYRLASVPAGTYTVTFAYIGYKSETRTVTIVDGQTVELNVALDVVAVTTEEIVVMGQLQGQSRALNNQAASNKIVNIVDAERIGEFPDQNAAEAVARIPGVALRRDGGEGQKLIIRGLDPNLSSATINGERIPATAGGVDGNRLQDVGRSASLSFIPPDMIKTIEVFKALTPDQDADAIGGTVNFITRNAKEGLQFNANGRWGYHFLDRDPTMYQFNAFGSNRFLDGKLGAVFTASYQRANRSAESYDAGYIQTVDSLPLNDLRIADRVEYRSRLGLSGAIDVDLGGGSELVFRGNYGSTNRDAIERRTRYFTTVAGNSSRALNRDIRDRRITTDLINLSVSGKHIFGAPELDYQFSFSRSGSDQPTSTSVAFQLSNALAPQIRTAGNIGIADVQQFAYDTTRFGSARANGANGFLYTFPVLSGNVFQTFNSADRDFAGRANFKLPLTLSNNATGYIKLGGMFRTKVRDSFVNEISLSAPRTDSLARAFGLVGPTENVRFSTFIDSSFADSDFLNGRFFLDRSFNLSRVNDFFLNQVPRSLYNTIEVRDVLNYVARENVGGGYMMGEFNIGDNLMVLGGLRYEFTAVDAQGVYGIISQVNSQRFGSRVDSTVQTNYGALFPMFHLRYRFQPQTELRLAVTRTLSRPNYYDVVPYEEVLFGESTIRRGNPNLQPTLSWNFDAMFSQYLGNIGILSFGAFHKRIDNYIYQVSTIELRFNEDGDEVPFIIRTPTNASFSRIWGIEVDIQLPLDFLPGFLKNLRLYANYSFLNTETVVPQFLIIRELDGRVTDRVREVQQSERRIQLPGQTNNVLNVALGYEGGGFSGRLSYNFQDRNILSVNINSERGNPRVPFNPSIFNRDTWFAPFGRMDFTASYRPPFALNYKFFLEVTNLTNQPETSYLGDPSRILYERFYGVWGNFGVGISF